jgi:hypothetical protein
MADSVLPKNQNAADPWVRGDLVCHARRHWNSTSYRSAAGIYLLARNIPSLGRKYHASGAEGDRTPDLCSAIAALSQLSYSPVRGDVNLVGKSASNKLTTHFSRRNRDIQILCLNA